MPLPDSMPNEDCLRCRRKKWKFDRAIAVGPYRGDLREAIKLMKQSPQERLRRIVAGLMAEKMNQLELEFQSSKPPLIVPVPDHWSHRWGPKAATTQSLAQEIGRQTRFPLAIDAIRKIRKTSKQGMLSWNQRPSNVRNAFQISQAEGLKGRHVVLVDDVFTSGATAAEISRVLKSVGVSSVQVLVAARGTGMRD